MKNLTILTMVEELTQNSQKDLIFTTDHHTHGFMFTIYPTKPILNLSRTTNFKDITSMVEKLKTGMFTYYHQPVVTVEQTSLHGIILD